MEVDILIRKPLLRFCDNLTSLLPLRAVHFCICPRMPKIPLFFIQKLANIFECCVQGTVLVASHTAVNKIKILAFMGDCLLKNYSMNLKYIHVREIQVNSMAILMREITFNNRGSWKTHKGADI